MTIGNDFRYFADLDASWTLPHTAPSSSSSPYSNRRQQQNNGNLDSSSVGDSNITPIVFPKQLFHGLAGLLVCTLCVLLVELNSPGVATRVGNRLFGSRASLTMNKRSSHRNYYSPVPSPFLAPKSARASMVDLQEIAPTSEPTVVTSMDMQGKIYLFPPYHHQSSNTI